MKFVFVRKPVVNARPLLSIFIIAGMSLAVINAGFGQDKQTPNIVTQIPRERVTSGAIAAFGPADACNHSTSNSLTARFIARSPYRARLIMA